MTTTQAALYKLDILSSGHVADGDENGQSLIEDIRTTLTRLSELEKAAEGMEGVLRDIVHAIDTGNIDSPEIGEHGHKWHEEWLYYASEKLAAYRTVKAALQSKGRG